MIVEHASLLVIFPSRSWEDAHLKESKGILRFLLPPTDLEGRFSSSALPFVLVGISVSLHLSLIKRGRDTHHTGANRRL